MYKGIIMLIYHSPNGSDSSFLDYLENSCSGEILNQKVIIMGDFNIDMKLNNYTQGRLIRGMHSVGLKQLVKEPTRIVRTSETIIDLVFSNDEVEVDVWHEPKITDHSMLVLYWNIKMVDKTDRIIFRRNYKKMNISKFISAIENYMNIGEEDSINEMAGCIVGSIVKSLDLVAPNKMIVIKNKWQGKKWFTEEIYRLMRQRDMAYRTARSTKLEEDWDLYRQLRNVTVDVCRKAKREYLIEKLDNSTKEPKRMWKVLKEMLKGSQYSEEYKELDCNNKIISNVEEMAEKFNMYFVESVKKLRKDGTHTVKEGLNKQLYTNNIFETFHKIEVVKLKSVVRKLRNKSGTEEGINVEVMKLVVEVAGEKIAYVYNKSLELGEFPNKWKESIIVPVPKVRGTIKVQEFRPINKLPVYEKVLEIMVQKQLVNYLENSGLIQECQSGFRAKHSCETALQWVISSWKKIIGEGKLIGVVFLDLRRAFEVVNRDILINKLERFGLKGNVLKWFKSYLENRTQRVKFNGRLSNAIRVDLGVPQGSVLGPLLFLLYINDITDVISDKCVIRLFADDALIYTTGHSSQEISDKLNEQIMKVETWLDKNRLTVNISKTKIMVIRGVRRRAVEEVVKVKMNDQILEVVSEIKYLGIIIIDKNLNFSAHIDYIIRKAGGKLGVMRRVSAGLSRDMRCTVYRTIVAPLFEYCASIFVGLSETNVQRLQKLQNQGMRIILRCDRRERIVNMLEALQFMSIKERIEYNICMLIYKIVNGLCPRYLSREVELVQSRSNVRTRQRNNIYIDRCRSREEQKMLLHDGFKMFTNLPSKIKMERNLRDFKRLLVNIL